MRKYRVTIKVTETYTYDAYDARCQDDAVAEAFERRYLWLRKPDEEYSVTTEYRELADDE